MTTTALDTLAGATEETAEPEQASSRHVAATPLAPAAVLPPAAVRLAHAEAPSTKAAPKTHDWRTALLPAVGIGGFLLGWQVLAAVLAKPQLLPGPWSLVAATQTLVADGTLWPDVAASLGRVFGGFLLATVIGIPLALSLAYSQRARFLVLPVLSLLRPIPPIAWIPLSILWFGIGDTASFFITALAAFFPIFLNALAGGMAIDRRHVQAAQCLGATEWSLFHHVLLPSALPLVWTGLKIGLGQSWMAVVTSELVGAQSGLGYMIQVNRLNLETPAVIVGMVAIGLMGAVMAAGLTAAERWVLPWRRAA
ncbi:MAG TPA: ABC transporter permease [Tepidisphaeraceae bacterium]|nr:ABC transporter permease [Tepidisphaeraceae bacterium]